MISAKSTVPCNQLPAIRFKDIYRGYRDWIVLIPGWASDYRIFRTLDLSFNYLLPMNFSPSRFEKDFLRFLRKNNIKNISMFGWSLGGFVAADFSSRHKDRIDELILVAIRKKYRPEEIEFVRQYLIRDRQRYLNRFYMQCFSEKRYMDWFKKNLFKDYSRRFSLDYLLQTLEYLKYAEIKADMLKGIKRLKIIHGKLDRIAPLQEAIDIKDSLRYAKLLLIEDAGHAPFLQDNLKQIL